MPGKGMIKMKGMKHAEYYEIAVRQFQQQVLPPGYPMTTVWSYGPFDDPRTVAEAAATITRLLPSRASGGDRPS